LNIIIILYNNTVLQEGKGIGAGGGSVIRYLINRSLAAVGPHTLIAGKDPSTDNVLKTLF